MADVRELSTDPAVKLSGVAAQTTDNATVVALSPNSNAVSVVSQPELVTTGTITTTDIVVAAPTGNGVLLTGTPTAGSYVAALATGGNASVVIGITGLTTGTIYYEGSADSTTGVDGNWISLNMKQAGIVNTQISSSATASGLYRGNTAGIRYIRMRSVGTLTGTPAITLRLSSGVAGEFLFGSIPTGTNTIGAANFNIANVSAGTILQNAVAVTGNGVNLPVTGYGTTVIQVSGTFVANVNFEASVDAGVTWTAISATQIGFGDIFSVVTTPGTFRLTTTGMDLIRARVTWTSGTSVTVSGKSTNAINASKIVKLATSANSIGTVQQAALTKGVQGATGVSTQDLKDSGRVSVVINCYQAPGIITTEALFAAATFSLTRDGGTPTTGQQFTVTTGKRFRLQAVMLGIKNTAAAAGTSKLVLRYAAAGGVLTNASPIALLWDFGSNATVANAYIGPGQYEIPDGLELLSASTYGFTVLSSAITMLHTITLIGYEY